MGITIRDIASHCGVGVGTVSRAMNNSGYVKEETKNAILRYAEEQGWQASSLAASLKTGKTKTVAVLANTFMHYDNAETLEQIVIKLRASGYHSFVSVGRSSDFAKEELRSYLERKIDAVVIKVYYEGIEADIGKLSNAGVRVIALWGGQASPDYVNICMDHRLLGYDGMKRLTDNGHRDIAYLGYLGKPQKVCCPDEFDVDEAHKTIITGVLDAAKDAKIAMNLNSDFVSDNFGDYSNFEELLLSRKHSAFICQNARVLNEFYSCCIKYAIQIPEDVSVITLGGTEGFKGLNPSPEYFKKNTDKITDLVVEEIVSKKFQSGKEFLIPCSLIPGKSNKKAQI